MSKKKTDVQKNVIVYPSILTTLLGVLLLLSTTTNGQDHCAVPFDFSPSVQNNTVNWQQFPQFTLPFDICYGGPNFGGQATALNYGFSHVSEPAIDIPIGKRALIYYGVAYPFRNQPWEILRSPWGNDEELYQQKWRDDHLRFVNTTDNTGKPVIDIDWFVFDIERQIKSNDSILLLRNHPSTPQNIKDLANAEFVKSYKVALQNLYYQPIQIFKSQGLSTPKLSAYGDSPILNTFTDIQVHTWEEWKTNKELLNANVVDFDENRVGGNFYNAQSILMPSAYYYFDYPSPFAGEYLSYLLFQIEVNKAWSDKPVYPFVWMKYSANPALRNTFVRPWMAEATAIFPFFSGAEGLWMWEDPTTFGFDLNYSAYEYFKKGLYRLSAFKTFFEGNHELVIDESAHELHRKRSPVWRGVVKEDNILIAAHNPFARNEADETIVNVRYGNWSRLISLKGYEVFLCAFDMNVLAQEEDISGLELNVFPNPSAGNITLRFNSTHNETGNLTFFDASGKKLRDQEIDVQHGQNQMRISIPKTFGNFLYLRLNVGKQSRTIKLSTL